MSEYLTIQGGQAYSEFRRRTLARKLNAIDVEARFLHFIHLHANVEKQSPSDFDLESLKRLLSYGDPYIESLHEDGCERYEFFISPRTMSPWSSKATNIAQVDGFGRSVRRIERGVMVTITSKSPIDEQLAMDLLHDRMTQTFSREIPEMERLFAELDLNPAEIIDLDVEGTSPHEALQSANKRLGLALDASEIDYLVNVYSEGGSIGRSPHDVELFMFSQVETSLAKSIKSTYAFIPLGQLRTLPS